MRTNASFLLAASIALPTSVAVLQACGSGGATTASSAGGGSSSETSSSSASSAGGGTSTATSTSSATSTATASSTTSTTSTTTATASTTGAGGSGGSGGAATSTGMTGSGGSSSTATGSSGSSGGAGGSGGSSSSASTTATSSASASASTASASSSASTGSGGPVCSDPNAGLPNVPCTPADPSCLSQTSECLAVLDNAGAAAFGLRIAQVSFTKPTAFTVGLVKGAIASAILPSRPVCNLNGGGTFSWLLSYDSVAGTLKTGGALPGVNPPMGYTFADQIVQQGNVQLHVQPVTLTAPIDMACGVADTNSADVILPVYLDAMGANVIYMPLRKLRFAGVTVSGDHDCIGKYNAAGLDPANACIADAAHPTYLDGGQAIALINLEDADAIPITAIGQTLCVLLSQNSAMYGDGAVPINHCKRQNGKIVFPGDWCTSNNMPAAGGCSDAVLFSGTFSASGVKIN
jgi:hypothetical protein